MDQFVLNVDEYLSNLRSDNELRNFRTIYNLESILIRHFPYHKHMDFKRKVGESVNQVINAHYKRNNVKLDFSPHYLMEFDFETGTDNELLCAVANVVSWRFSEFYWTFLHLSLNKEVIKDQKDKCKMIQVLSSYGINSMQKLYMEAVTSDDYTKLMCEKIKLELLKPPYKFNKDDYTRMQVWAIKILKYDGSSYI